MAQNLLDLLTILNTTNAQKTDQRLYDFLRRLLIGTHEIGVSVNAIGSSSSGGGGGSTTNITNQQFFISDSDGGDGGGDGIPIPGSAGAQGIQGIPGPAGNNTTIMITEDGIDGEMISIPGSQGIQGNTGATGAAGITSIVMISEDGIDGETIAIPGPKGDTGTAGITTVQSTIVAISEDGIDGEPSYIPGPLGPVATMVEFTQDLGSGNSSGTFDITGLSGLTPDLDVTIVQTAQPIASKGNARDEFEMDAIQLTGYVLNSTTIRVYWWSPSVAVGIYAFAFAVAPGAVPLGGISNRVAQIVSTMSSTVTTGSTQIPADNTIPQITEGDEVMTRTITPINAGSTLKIEVLVMGASDTTGRIWAVALFQDALTDALAANGIAVPGANSALSEIINYTMIAGSTSLITFRVRVGLSGTGTYTFNGSAGVQRYSTNPKSSIVITEYLP